LKVRTIATKLLKQYEQTKSFNRQEAYKFVSAVIRQAKAGASLTGMEGFDAHWKALANGKPTLDYTVMANLCIKVSKWGRPPTIKSNFPVYESLQKMMKNATTTHKVNQCT
jgi:hypothetical protein